MRAFRVARFARHVGHDGAIPIGKIQNLPVRSAVGLLVTHAAGCVYSVAITWASHRTTVEGAHSQGVPETDLMDLAPLPGFNFGAEFVGCLIQGSSQRRAENFWVGMSRERV